MLANCITPNLALFVIPTYLSHPVKFAGLAGLNASTDCIPVTSDERDITHRAFLATAQVIFASNTSVQDVTEEALGWSERVLKRTKASLDLRSKPSFHLVFWGGVMLRVFSVLLFVFPSLGPEDKIMGCSQEKVNDLRFLNQQEEQ
ncbi:hypothetical protein STEG23_028007, partial [Scotinomys teguina]